MQITYQLAMAAGREARHRHNWPALCKRNKRFAAFIAEHYPPQVQA